MKQHQRAISDLDWSLDNTFLLSAGLEGSVTMWMAATGQLLRIFLTTSPACCAKFHLVNQNLIIAGTESGVLQVFNCSTGMHVMLGTHSRQYTKAFLHPPIFLVPLVRTSSHHHFGLSVSLQTCCIWSVSDSTQYGHANLMRHACQSLFDVVAHHLDWWSDLQANWH